MLTIKLYVTLICYYTNINLFRINKSKLVIYFTPRPFSKLMKDEQRWKALMVPSICIKYCVD